MLETLKSRRKLIGLKQTLRALQEENVELCILAKDADDKFKQCVIEACESKSVKVIIGDERKKMGKYCDIDVGAAVVCVLK